jgi:hypothetical protein
MQIYKDEASLAALVVRVVLRARDVGQPAIVIAAEPSRQKIIDALKAAQVALDGSDGRNIEILDARHVLRDIMVGDRPDPARFRHVVGSILTQVCRGRQPCVAVVYSDMADVLVRHDNTSAALSLEILWNRLATEHTFSLVCGYAASDLHEPVPSVEELQEICDQHNLVERSMN